MRNTPNGPTARCPAHDDNRNSLCVSEGEDGRVLLCCQAHCETSAVVEKLGLKMTDLFPAKERTNGQSRIAATYDYRDETAILLYQAVQL